MTKNLLDQESSPYLLQHANNPVHWFPWGRDALDRAKKDNRLIFLSIGYSACHWCHVMAHESFENKDVADIMNEYFVNIKVDREERPDIDAIYQSACQHATGQGGWPLSVFLTPEQKPVYIGTYFPVLDGYGRPGFGSLIRQLAQAWKERPSDMVKAAEKFTTNLNVIAPTHSSIVDRSLLDEAVVTLLQLGDTTYGGFGSAPKFPNVACISFLFRYAQLSGISKFTDFALRSLRKMAKGGIFDQLAGGFHRYSTDRQWLVPHFEKMLYDNALIPMNYAEAYQITQDEFFLKIMKKTLNFVLRDMTSPEGVFYSALDADSEGEEGRFYVWSKAEILDILGDDADVFCPYYDVTAGGNWEGNNILCNNLNLSTVASLHSMQKEDVQQILDRCEGKLLAIRETRQKPGLDDKVLASWNGMMITALARGYRVSSDDRYMDAARKALQVIMDNMLDRNGIYRIYGSTGIRGFLEDYAWVCGALLDVFEECPDKTYLDAAHNLGEHMCERFWDDTNEQFFMTPNDHESLIMRPISEYDMSVPSGSSVAIMCMTRLYHLTGENKFLDVATRTLKSKIRKAADNPFAFGHLLNAAHMHVRGVTEVTVLGADDNIRRMLSSKFLPEDMVINVQNETQIQNLEEYQFFSGKRFERETSAYVCKNGTCSPPLFTIPDIEARL